jgi:hypothetical protein
MAGGWYVLLERDVPGLDISADGGKSLLYFHRQIDDLSARLQLPPISGFFRPDRAGVLAYLQEQGVEPDPDALPDEDWFEPEDGLDTVRGLLDQLRADPTSAPSGEKLIGELEEIERILGAAEREGVRFRLSRKLPPPPKLAE